MVVILLTLLHPFDFVDATTHTWSNHPKFLARYERENSKPAPVRFFDSSRQPPPSLPVVSDKPIRTVRIAARGVKKTILPGRNRVEVVRKGKSVGNGSCVQYARSQGVPAHGLAKNTPTLAKKAGFKVDLQPAVNAAIVTSESSAGTNTGHVTGPIQKIEGNWGYQCEQNYVRGTVTCGWIDLTNPTIVAFIHLN